jgi:hypothetical protein
MKKYRFFYHYNKQAKKMSVHFKGVCHIVTNITCYAIANTKYNKRQPYLVMQGMSSSVVIANDRAIIAD